MICLILSDAKEPIGVTTSVRSLMRCNVTRHTPTISTSPSSSSPATRLAATPRSHSAARGPHGQATILDYSLAFLDHYVKGVGTTDALKLKAARVADLRFLEQ